jgi:AraC-like DNA-binding protein
MNGCATECPSIRFSTRGLPEGERLSRWREEFGRSLLRVEIEPVSSLPFHAEAKLRALPGLRTADCLGPPMRFERTPALAADGDDSIGFVINRARAAVASQRGREVALRAGDAVPILTQEPAILTTEHHLGVLVPRAALASRLSNIDDAGMRVISRRAEAMRLLTGYISMVDDKLTLGTPELRDTVISHLHDLIALALTQNSVIGESGLSAIADARLNAALYYITAHFHEPELSLADAARDQGVSPRYLQRLIEAAGTTFTMRVTELRLQRAFALLCEAHDGSKRISDIALQAGFFDISYFNRLFRSRFGDTPRGVRQRGAK